MIFCLVLFSFYFIPDFQTFFAFFGKKKYVDRRSSSVFFYSFKSLSFSLSPHTFNHDSKLDPSYTTKQSMGTLLIGLLFLSCHPRE